MEQAIDQNSYANGREAALRGCVRMIWWGTDVEREAWYAGWDSISSDQRGTWPLTGPVPERAGPAVVELFTPVDRPDSDGWYWYRWSRDGHDWQCIEVKRDTNGHYWAIDWPGVDGQHDIENMVDGEWRGPIPMPPK